MNEITTAAPKMKSTMVRRARTGRVLVKVTVALDPVSVAAFRGECARRNTCMSTKLQEWIGQWLASLAPAAPPPSNGSPQ